MINRQWFNGRENDEKSLGIFVMTNKAILGVGFIFSCQNKFENLSLAKEHFSVLNLPVSARNGGSQGFPHVISPKTS